MANISTATWSGSTAISKQISISGTGFKATSELNDVEIQAPSTYPTETAANITVSGSEIIIAFSTNIPKNTANAAVRVKGADGQWTGFKTID